MATLKTIITEYINLLNKPFDIALYRRVRQLVINQRAFELAKAASRFGVDNTLIQYIQPTFEKAPDNLGMILDVNDRVLITENKILRTAIAISKESPFFYVGSTDLSLPFTYVNNKASVSRLRNNKYFARTPLYLVIDSKVVCIVKNGTENLSIGHAWHDAGKIDLMNGDIEEEYFDDTYEFLISHDMLQVIKEKLLKGELGVIAPDDKEVKLEGEPNGQTTR